MRIQNGASVTIKTGGEKMNGLMSWMEKYILPVATKIGSEKHLVALRDAFIGTMPATMAGAIAVLLNAFMRDFPNTYLGEGNAITTFFTPVIGVNGLIWNGTLAIMAVVFALSLGANLAKAYEVDPVSGSIVSLVAFIIGLPDAATAVLALPEKLSQDAADLITSAGGVIAGTPDGGQTLSVGAWGYFNFGKYMGGSGLFTAMIFGFISVIIFAILIKKKIIIRMPDSVPPAVARAFAAIIPALVSLYVVGVINYIFRQTAGEPLIDWISEAIQSPLMNLSQGYGAVFIIVLLVHVLWFFGLHGTNIAGEPLIDWISEAIQSPLMNLSQGYGAVFIIVLLVHVLWFFGLHGTNIMSPVLQTLYGTAMVENTNAFQNNEPIPFKWVAGSFEAFVWPGGAGVTLVLIVMILFLSKRADYKTVGKLGLAPGIFNINEPVMFGLPVVLNPLLMIPFILAPLATATIAYFATMAGLVRPVVVNVIWVMPTIISGFLATA